MLSNLSFVISVHERQDTLYRLLPHLKTFGCEVVVTDSSQEAFDKNFLDEMGCIYIHEPGVNYYQNILNGLNSSSKDYVLQLADDDFVLKSTVEKCVEFLVENKDFVYADGLHLQFNEKGAKLQKNYGLNFFTHNREHNALLSFDERLNQAFNLFAAPNHAVVRKECLKETFDFILEHEQYHPVRYCDKILAIFYAARGSGKTLDALYQLRSADTRLITQHDYPKELKRDVHFSELVKDFMLPDSDLILFISSVTGETYLRVQEQLIDVVGNYPDRNNIIYKEVDRELASRKPFSLPWGSNKKIDRIFNKAVESTSDEVAEILKIVREKPILMS